MLETNNLFNNLIQRNQSAAFSSGKVRPNHETNINIIARRTGKDVNSHTVLDGIITTIMATIQRINIIGSREGSRNRRRLKANLPMLGFHKQMDNRIKLLEEILSFRMQGVEFDNGDMYVDGHKAASDVRDEFVSVTEKLMDELAQCYNVLPQLDINNTIDHRP